MMMCVCVVFESFALFTFKGVYENPKYIFFLLFFSNFSKKDERVAV